MKDETSLDKITEYSLKLGLHLNKLFKEIDKDNIQIGEDEDCIYYFNPKHECRTTKNKHWMRLKNE